MAAPLAGGAVEIALTDELISAPYVALTYGLMAQFGVKVENEGPNQRFKISSGQTYQSPGTVFVEGDASSASYFLAAGAITGGPVTVVGCGSASVQGDVAFANVLEQMGATVEWGERGRRLTYGFVCVWLWSLHHVAWNHLWIHFCSGCLPVARASCRSFLFFLLILFPQRPTPLRCPAMSTGRSRWLASTWTAG